MHRSTRLVFTRRSWIVLTLDRGQRLPPPPPPPPEKVYRSLLLRFPDEIISVSMRQNNLPSEESGSFVRQPVLLLSRAR